MKKISIIAALALMVATTAHAQIQVGIGMGAPVAGRTITTSAHLDGAGTVHADDVLDSSPQIVVEVHRTFKIQEKMGIGPFLGFAPKIDMGTSSNTGSQTPLGAGFGMLMSINAGAKHRINVGAMWLITAPITQVHPDWRDGFQAPRSRQDIPLDVQLVKGSVNRLMMTFTVSGIF